MPDIRIRDMEPGVYFTCPECDHPSYSGFQFGEVKNLTWSNNTERCKACGAMVTVTADMVFKVIEDGGSKWIGKLDG